MRIAHLSDPHVIDWSETRWQMFMNKRITGGVNFALFRGKHHRRHVLEAIVSDIAQMDPDHVVVTGDISSLSFKGELETFRALLDSEGFNADRVSVIPGNHDTYTRRAWTKRRALVEMAPFATSDLGGDMPGFPFVRLRGQLAIIGLNSAIARPWFIASGLIGHRQLDVLGALLETPQVRQRYPVILVHHPPIAYPSWLKEVQSGLMDRDQLLDVLRKGLDGRDALVLSGHWHERRRVRLDLPGQVELLVASSASHLGGPTCRVAAYHLIHLEPVRDGRLRLDRVDVRGFSEESGKVESV